MILSVVTPDKSMVKNLTVESVVLPGELGQMTILPGHVSLITALSHGSFAYKEKDKSEWRLAFLNGGFAQVTNNEVMVLAETMEFASEVDIAQAELEVQSLNQKLKLVKLDSAEYPELNNKKIIAESRLAATKKQAN